MQSPIVKSLVAIAIYVALAITPAVAFAGGGSLSNAELTKLVLEQGSQIKHLAHETKGLKSENAGLKAKLAKLEEVLVLVPGMDGEWILEIQAQTVFHQDLVMSFDEGMSFNLGQFHDWAVNRLETMEETLLCSAAATQCNEVNCDDGNPCTQDGYNEYTGSCSSFYLTYCIECESDNGICADAPTFSNPGGQVVPTGVCNSWGRCEQDYIKN